MKSATPILVTGNAGFIGHAVSHRLLDRGERVVGVDDINSYYDPTLKSARLATLALRDGFSFIQGDIAATGFIESLLRKHEIVRVVHLAAQAGVRYSINNPFAYQHSNLAGHLAVIEACRHQSNFVHLVYASSSSVYGDRQLNASGFSEDDSVDHPVSLYAATKRSCELMSSAYAKLYGIPQTGLRFFTVYGPWGRPDMAYFSFTRAILAGQPIEIYGEGRMSRDFTFIDDIVDGIVGSLDVPPSEGEHRILNVGDSNPISLLEMISTLEGALNLEAKKIMRPMQSGDVSATFADISRIHSLTGYTPKIALAEGLKKFVDWYVGYHGGVKIV